MLLKSFDNTDWSIDLYISTHQIDDCHYVYIYLHCLRRLCPREYTILHLCLRVFSGAVERKVEGETGRGPIGGPKGSTLTFISTFPNSQTVGLRRLRRLRQELPQRAPEVREVPRRL